MKGSVEVMVRSLSFGSQRTLCRRSVDVVNRSTNNAAVVWNVLGVVGHIGWK